MNTAVKSMNVQVAARAFRREGHWIERGLFEPGEAVGLREHFMELHAKRAFPKYPWKSLEEAGGDLLKVYPRVLFPHRFDGMSKRFFLDPRIAEILRALLDEEPVALQTMLYFKPPGARGQAFHQDNFYARVRPKTCVAAWVALDRADPENGGLFICPGTQDLDIQCPETADLGASISSHLVRPPAGITPIPAILDPGDVLFFNGSVIHGSQPNGTESRWRRSFICHYAPASMQECARWYHPVLDMDGNPMDFGIAVGGGPCGGEYPAELGEY